MAEVPTLNPEQQAAYDTLLAYITGKDKTYPMWLLSGYAGTGKTFTLSQIVRSLDDINNINLFGNHLNVAMSAPTHKAVRVMKKFAKAMPGVTFATIHSLLGLKEQIQNDGKIKFVQSTDPDQIRIERFGVLFIDESSMLADELFYLLLPYVRRGLKLVFVGDAKQIPPVNHIDSKPFLPKAREEYHIGLVELDKIMRQALDNPILAYATRIRKAEGGTADFSVTGHIVEGVGGIMPIDSEAEEQINNLIEKYFCCEEFKQDADYMKIVAWRNVTVDAYNKIVRRCIYKDHVGALPFLMHGEKLIVDKPVVLGNEKILLTTNEEIEVADFEIKQMDVKYRTAEMKDKEWVMIEKTMQTQYYNTFVNYFDEEGTESRCNIRILHESSQAEVTSASKSIANVAKQVYNGPLRTNLWKSFYGLERLFAAVKYNYAITGHKSQGSTYENCMLIDWDINYNRNIVERNRIRYVAATRARKMLYVVK